MVNSENQQSMNDRKIDDVEDRTDQSNSGDFPHDSASTADASSRVLQASCSISRALPVMEIPVEDGDLLHQQSDRVDNLVHWLRALDVQVMGACRADERLKPLLKLNASTGAAEDRLLAHLSQNFEPSEVGMLARCICVPLVSVRVGKVNKLGSLLYPTATRRILTIS